MPHSRQPKHLDLMAVINSSAQGDVEAGDVGTVVPQGGAALGLPGSWAAIPHRDLMFGFPFRSRSRSSASKGDQLG